MILDAGRRFRLSSPSHLIRFHYQMRENIYVCLDAHIIIPLSPPFLVAYFSGGWNEGSKDRSWKQGEGKMRREEERSGWAHHNVSFHR